MKKNIYYILIVIIAFLSSCAEKGEPYIVMRTTDSTTLTTKNGAYLFLNAYIDSVFEVEVHNAKVATNIFLIDSTKEEILYYGHCWTADKNQLPIFQKNLPNHTQYENNLGKNISSLLFSSKVTGLSMDTVYFVRSYVITKDKFSTQIDTGYNQSVTKFRTKVPENLWIHKSDLLSTEREDAVSFTIGSFGYIALGYDGLTCLKDLWRFDPKTDIWWQGSDFGNITTKGRRGAVAFVINDTAYVGTGNSSSDPKVAVLESDFWKYVPETNRWIRCLDSLPGIKRENAIAFAIGKRGYVGLGSSSSGSPLKDFYMYNPAEDTAFNPVVNGSWHQQAPFAGSPNQGDGRTEAAAAALQNKGYVTGGKNVNGTIYNDLWEFDPANNTWIRKANMPVGTERYNATAFALNFERNNRTNYVLYVGTGINSNKEKLKDFYAFDITTGSWTKKADVGGSTRSGAVGLTINYKDDTNKTVTRGYIGLGSGAVRLKDFWEFLP